MGGSERGTILVLIGIPGSGKTTTSRRLHKELAQMNLSPVHICYDHFLKDRQFWRDPDYSWKAERNQIQNLVVWWLCQQVHQTISPPSIPEDLRRTFSDSISNSPGNHPLCVLVDDNMYYRSMRHSYFQIARQFHLGFAQLCLHCPVATALARNAGRPESERVPESIVHQMHSRLQLPNPADFPWEKFSLVVSSDSVSSDQIRGLVEAAAKEPPEQPIWSEEQKAESREATGRSGVHQMDLLLREAVAGALEEASLERKKELAGRLSRRKMELLQKFKEGHLYCDNVEMDRDLLIELLLGNEQK